LADQVLLKIVCLLMRWLFSLAVLASPVHRTAASRMPLRLSPHGSVPPGNVEADGQITVRRSCRLYGWTKNALLSRYFRFDQENLNPSLSLRFPAWLN
jgi:hypothetical protein